MPDHVITVSYTNDDDGIHLRCECGWKTCLDHEPTVESLTAAADRHKQAIQAEPPTSVD